MSDKSFCTPSFVCWEFSEQIIFSATSHGVTYMTYREK